MPVAGPTYLHIALQGKVGDGVTGVTALVRVVRVCEGDERMDAPLAQLMRQRLLVVAAHRAFVAKRVAFGVWSSHTCRCQF